MTFPLLVALLLLFAAWFTLSVAAVLVLYALALRVDDRRRRLIEAFNRQPSPVPDYLPECWEWDVLERRS